MPYKSTATATENRTLFDSTNDYCPSLSLDPRTAFNIERSSRTHELIHAGKRAIVEPLLANQLLPENVGWPKLERGNGVVDHGVRVTGSSE